MVPLDLICMAGAYGGLAFIHHFPVLTSFDDSWDDQAVGRIIFSRIAAAEKWARLLQCWIVWLKLPCGLRPFVFVSMFDVCKREYSKNAMAYVATVRIN